MVYAGVAPGQRRRVEPDWAALARELKRPGVTMMILWEEYREVHPEGYGYSRFCDLLRGFERRLTPVMRQHHVAGEKAFVDYSGKRIGIADPRTGEIREAEIFVGVLGASNLTYAEATWTQTSCRTGPAAHVAACSVSSAARRSLLVPDNLKSGVTKASASTIREINRTYGAMAAHYSVGKSCRRGQESRGTKAKVEAGVKSSGSRPTFSERLRELTAFFSLAECNEATAPRHAPHERSPHAQPRPEPSRSCLRRSKRDASHRLATRRRLGGVRRVEARAGQSRLSHRGP